MADLEKLIRDRQDELRGRPRDWIDDFTAWHRRMDWVTVWVVVAMASPLVAMTIWIMVQ